MNKYRFFSMFLLLLFVVSCKSSKVSNQIDSQYFTDSIYSKSLSEYRKHNIYLPENFNPKNKYPIFYVTDGSDISSESFIKSTLDSLIKNKFIKPVIYIESHRNKKIADSSYKSADGSPMKLAFRNFEYIKRSDIGNLSLQKRFPNHMKYFSYELIPYIENKLNQNINKEDRYFYGYSNGAGFGMSLLNINPNLIGTYICHSTFGGDIKENKWQKNTRYAKLYLIYGSKEPPMLMDDAEFLKIKYQELNLFCEIKEFDGGHDHKIWNKEFIKTISKILKN